MQVPQILTLPSCLMSVGSARSWLPALLCFVIRLGSALFWPQELLEHGLCEEVERVRLSERYQSMKVHT